jgi:hypothetical protein
MRGVYGGQGEGETGRRGDKEKWRWEDKEKGDKEKGDWAAKKKII